jgi:hypothetical protein
MCLLTPDRTRLLLSCSSRSLRLRHPLLSKTCGGTPGWLLLQTATTPVRTSLFNVSLDQWSDHPTHLCETLWSDGARNTHHQQKNGFLRIFWSLIRILSAEHGLSLFHITATFYEHSSFWILALQNFIWPWTFVDWFRIEIPISNIFLQIFLHIWIIDWAVFVEQGWWYLLYY